MALTESTIAAIATAPGAGAIGIVRISGPAVPAIATGLLGRVPTPRQALYATFSEAGGAPIDQGLALYFPAPRSFTGEDVLELQGHGGPVVLDLLLRRVFVLGARPARPGEFSERAFLNGKLDLAQAEAIADLISSATATQARLASRSLHGAFSRQIARVQATLTRLRALTEAALDFPDEALEDLTATDLGRALVEVEGALAALAANARQGELVRDGYRVVIAGPPNAGKSSLLNALSGADTAIVTAVPGTTRDPLRTDIQLDGLPLRIVDTAGLRESTDPIEQEGIRRARAEIALADHLLWVTDAARESLAHTAGPARAASLRHAVPDLPAAIPVTWIHNKADLIGATPAIAGAPPTTQITCSALTGAGLELLREHLKASAGYRGPDGGEFSARRRHLTAIARARQHVNAASSGFAATGAAELMAEDLRQAQLSLAEITGEVSADDLLGQIFSEFCIGK